MKKVYAFKIIHGDTYIESSCGVVLGLCPQSRYMKSLITVVFLLLCISCSREVPSDRLVKRNGVTYEVNSQRPFNGISMKRYEEGQYDEWSYKEGKRYGLQKYYYENGQLGYEGFFNEMGMTGFWSFYYKNGQLEEKTFFKDGEKDSGPSISYYPNGQLWMTGFFSNGDREGPWEYYHQNGQLERKGSFKNGESDGPWVVYFEDGQLRERTSYKDGKEHGLWEYFRRDGQRTEVCYVEGSGVSLVEYDTNGSVKRKKTTELDLVSKFFLKTLMTTIFFALFLTGCGIKPEDYF